MNALIAAIAHGDLHPRLPQTVTLGNGEFLRCDQLLRLLPGKRGVFKARYRQRDVLAKIFLGSATRQADRERAGYERLRIAHQPTPARIDDVACADGRVLIYEFMNAAQPLFREDAVPDIMSLQRVLDRLQSMYDAGVYHDDLHWGNFLWGGDTAYVIDAGAVLGDPSKALPVMRIIDNLGVFISQFYRRDQPLVYEAVINHGVCAQFALAALDIKRSAEKHWRLRKKILLQKCFRSSTSQSFNKQFNRVYACRRAYAGADLDRFLANPETMMARGQALKLGNSATVAKLVLDGRTVAIKRYNMKNFLHWLQRCWRPSRAWTSWRNAHRLELLGLHTPAPIAFLEMRCGWLRRRAYYVCEYIEGEALSDALQRRDPSPAEITELENYFKLAAGEQLIHGDMKANNFLIKNNRLVILDLDAMREVPSAVWKKLFLRDFERFRRNWLDEPSWLHRLGEFIAAQVK